MNKRKQSTSKQKQERETKMNLIFTHTPETIRAMLYDNCHKAPQITIEDLLRAVAQNDYGVAADTVKIMPMAEIFKIFAAHPEKGTLVLPAVLGMRAGDMAGEVSANQNTAKGIADKILGVLTLKGERMTKDAMVAVAFSDMSTVADLANRPQEKADFKAALAILVANTSVKRLTSEGNSTEKKWAFMQVPAKAKADKAEKPAK